LAELRGYFKAAVEFKADAEDAIKKVNQDAKKGGKEEVTYISRRAKFMAGE
jgi:hypothetical protein